MEQLFTDQGVLGAVVVILLTACGVLWRQNQALQKELRDTLREVFPVVQALQSAINFVEGRK